MKKIIFIFGFLSTIVLFTNSASGPAAAQLGGYAGSPLEQNQTCSACHGGGSYGASANLEVFDAAGAVAVSKYVLGQQYTIRLTISVTGSPAGYGFQMIDVQQSNNKNVKGFLPTAQQGANIGVVAAGSGNVYAEHRARLSSKVINVKWQAPTTNIGTVVFYAAANAVNGNGSEIGDSPTAGTSIQLPVSPTGTHELGEEVGFTLSPNPTPSAAVLTIDSKVSKPLKVQITDIRGRIVMIENWAVTAGQNQRTLDLTTFSKGLYMLQIIDNQDIISKKIVKL